MRVSIEDRFAIHDLLVRYTTALDSGDVDGIVSCFTEDGTLESPITGTHTGHAEIRAFSERFAGLLNRGVQLRHVISNLAVSVAGDEGTATCYLTNLMTVNGESQIGPPGRYECTLRRVDGEWLLRNRLVLLDAPFRLPGA